MHKRRLAATTALLIGTASLSSIATSPASATAAAILYVDNTSHACTDTGTGGAAAPFCTIQAAANVVAPGQTVLIGGANNNYSEDVKVKTSGTVSAPITFATAGTYFIDAYPDHDFTLTGVSNIVINGLYGVSTSDAVLVSGSSNITIENSKLRQGASGTAAATIAGVHVTGGSSAVTIERDWFVTHAGPFGTGVRIDGGSTGTVVATDYLGFFGTTGIAVVGAAGTEIAGNTIGNALGATCSLGISITSGSTSTSVENNVDTNLSSPLNAPCPAGSAAGLAVSADSAATTSAQYNVLTTDGGGTTPYEWAGASYTTAAAFHAATGKGAQDSVTDSVNLSTSAIPTASPLIDSADANAPGETTTDIYGNPRVDDPSIPNTGTGVGYYDRGAVEYQEYTSAGMSLSLASAQNVVAHVDLKGIPWAPSVIETYDWGDGTPKQSFTDPSFDTSRDYTFFFGATHTYASRSTYTVTETLTDAAGTKTLTGTISTLGSEYTPVAPTRVLDTRNGTGTAGKTTPVPAGSAIAVDVTSGVTGAPPLGTITAVVLNVTVTAPGSDGHITAYPDGSALPNASNLNFSPGETVPNLVTVKTGADGKVDLYNGSAGASHLVADVEGYYTDSGAGSGYVPATPTRLLDTRDGTGTGGSVKPVPAGGTIHLKIAGNSPVPASGVTAVVLNVTVTQSATNGFITVYPGGTAQPNASNLNFSPGETVPNLVIVPVGADGTVSLTNNSSGTTALLADVSGYYTGSGGDAFVPLDPMRVLDTRTGLGQFSAPHPVAAGGDQFINLVPGTEIVTGAALVLNVTVTQPTAAGFITAYAKGTTLPNVSNLNFGPGETVPNLVLTPYLGSGGGVLLHNGSRGTTDLVADAFGYFS